MILNVEPTQKAYIIWNITIEKSTVAFSCHIQFLRLEKAVNWPFLRTESYNGQSVRLNLFSKYVLFHLAFRRSQLPDYYNVDQELKCVT